MHVDSCAGVISMEEVKPVTEIQKRPKCAVENCNNGALVQFAGKWVCGDCAMKKHEEITMMVWG